jgi:hypothetical protein
MLNISVKAEAVTVGATSLTGATKIKRLLAAPALDPRH